VPLLLPVRLRLPVLPPLLEVLLLLLPVPLKLPALPVPLHLRPPLLPDLKFKNISINFINKHFYL
jgi:hypothetical protein